MIWDLKNFQNQPYFITVCADESINIWNSITQKQIEKIKTAQEIPTKLIISENTNEGEFIFGTKSGIVNFYNVEAKKIANKVKVSTQSNKLTVNSKFRSRFMILVKINRAI